MIGSGIPISHSNPPRSIAASASTSKPLKSGRLQRETHEDEKAMRAVATKAGEAAECGRAELLRGASGDGSADQRRSASIQALTGSITKATYAAQVRAQP